MPIHTLKQDSALLTQKGAILDFYVLQPSAMVMKTVAQVKAEATIKANLQIDTGAGATLICQSVIDKLGINPINKDVQISTPSSKGQGAKAFQYVVDLLLVLPNNADLHFRNVPVLATDMTHQPFNINGLLGRDILKFLHLTWNGKAGDVTVCF